VSSSAIGLEAFSDVVERRGVAAFAIEAEALAAGQAVASSTLTISTIAGSD
jgi:hypothetical protein